MYVIVSHGIVLQSYSILYSRIDSTDKAAYMYRYDCNLTELSGTSHRRCRPILRGSPPLDLVAPVAALWLEEEASSALE